MREGVPFHGLGPISGEFGKAPDRLPPVGQFLPPAKTPDKLLRSIGNIKGGRGKNPPKPMHRLKHNPQFPPLPRNLRLPPLNLLQHQSNPHTVVINPDQPRRRHLHRQQPSIPGLFPMQHRTGVVHLTTDSFNKRPPPSFSHHPRRNPRRKPTPLRNSLHHRPTENPRHTLTNGGGQRFPGGTDACGRRGKRVHGDMVRATGPSRPTLFVAPRHLQATQSMSIMRLRRRGDGGVRHLTADVAQRGAR